MSLKSKSKFGKFKVFSTSCLDKPIISEFSKNCKPPLEESGFSKGAFCELGFEAMIAYYWWLRSSVYECTDPPT